MKILEKIKEINKENVKIEDKALELAKLFQLNIDEKENYIIEVLNLQQPKLVLRNRENNKIYQAEIENKSNLLNIDKTKEMFLNTKEEEDRYIIEKTFNLEKEELVKRATIKNQEEDFEIVLQKDHITNKGKYNKNKQNFYVEYGQDIAGVIFPLYFRSLEEQYRDSKKISTFEEIGNFMSKRKRRINQTRYDKFTFNKNDSVIYGITKLSDSDNIHYFKGICCEEVEDKDLIEEILNQFEVESSEKVNAIIMFEGEFGDEREHNSLEIRKENGIITINYKITKEGKIIDTKQDLLQTNNKKGINAQEIEEIKEIIGKNKEGQFIELVQKELDKFREKIEKGNKIDDIDPLNPKFLINKRFEDIVRIILDYRDEYFKLIQMQFKNTIIKQNNNKKYVK